MSHNSKRHRLEEAKAIIAAGLPAASEKLPELVMWLCDQNSPGFSEIAEYLPSLGHLVVPHIKAVLAKTDDLGEWQSAILFTQVRHWPHEWLVEIQNELDDLAWHDSSQWDVDMGALSILVEHQLGNRDSLQLLITRSKEHCDSRLKKLDELEQQMQTYASNDDATLDANAA